MVLSRAAATAVLVAALVTTSARAQIALVPAPESLIVAAPPDAAPMADAAPPPTVTPSAPTEAAHLDAPATTLKKAGEVIKDLAKGDVKALRRGPLLMHGNYCGIGNKPGLPPVDTLDAACMHHDACTKTGSLPSCACNERLQIEATSIAEDANTAEALRALAGTVAASMAVLICH